MTEDSRSLLDRPVCISNGNDAVIMSARRWLKMHEIGTIVLDLVEDETDFREMCQILSKEVATIVRAVKRTREKNFGEEIGE
jgi:arsenate reductase-like glutaredoxin family protein